MKKKKTLRKTHNETKKEENKQNKANTNSKREHENGVL